MASSSQRSTARTPGALPPPPPEQFAAFYALVEKRVTAAVLGRHARCAELSDRAARNAERLYGDNSLVVADLRVDEASSLREMARASTSLSGKGVLYRRAWAILVPVHALLLRRLADKTLLPGNIKEEEVMHDACSQAFVCQAKDKAVPSEVVLQRMGATLGYETLLKAVFHTLALINELRGSVLPRERAHSFVLKALDAIPRTAMLQDRLQIEADLVATIETQMKPQIFEPSSARPCFVNGAPVMWQTCCAHVACCRPLWQHTETVMLHSKPARVPTLRRSGCENAPCRPVTRWSAPSASSSSALAVAPRGTAARNITSWTGWRTRMCARRLTRNDETLQHGTRLRWKHRPARSRWISGVPQRTSVLVGGAHKNCKQLKAARWAVMAAGGESGTDRGGRRTQLNREGTVTTRWIGGSVTARIKQTR